MGCGASTPKKDIYHTTTAQQNNYRGSSSYNGNATTEGYVSGGGGAPRSVPVSPAPVSKTTYSTEDPKAPRPSVNANFEGLTLSAHSSGTRKTTVTHHMRNVFVPRIEQDDISNFSPPQFEKDPAVEKFLRDTLSENFIFQHLPASDLNQIIKAFEKCEFKDGEEIIKQGDNGDYFFIVYDGECTFQVNDANVGTCSAGAGFGELALLYSSPRAATVIATPSSMGYEKTITTCYRVDQKTFRYVLQKQNQLADSEKMKILKKISFLKALENYQLQKLSSAMTLKAFSKNDYIVRKGEVGEHFYILNDGEVKVTDISVGSTVYEDFNMGPGEYFGERAIIKSEPRAANVVAVTDGVVFSIDRATFEKVLGDVANLILRSQDKRRLAGIKALKDTYLPDETLDVVASMIQDKNFRAGSTIITEGEETEPILYIVRSGKLHITNKDGSKDSYISEGELFGEEHITMDVGKQRVSHFDQKTFEEIQKETESQLFKVSDREAGNSRVKRCVSFNYSVTATEDTLCGILKFKDCRAVFDTTLVGKGKPTFKKSSLEQIIRLEDLKRHRVLGQGTFGQVWLVSCVNDDGVDICYALKIQSKYELVKDGQAKGVVQEMEIMNKLVHPFLLPLIRTYQDRDLIYMLLGLVQGGELFSRLHTDVMDGVPEDEAKFYAAGVSEALNFMHLRHIVYRDLKPENILIDRQGYPVIVDFGFAKYVPEQTYTFCGTPLYIAPEVILNKGHGIGADHWSLGCLIFEMITGDTPFYEEYMDQLALYRAICNGQYRIRQLIQNKHVALNLCEKFLQVDPSDRLGRLAGGQMDIFKHPWFSEIDFELLRNKEIPAPWIPKLKNSFDASNFENWDHLPDKTKEVFKPISDKDQKIFEPFGMI